MFKNTAGTIFFSFTRRFCIFCHLKADELEWHMWKALPIAVQDWGLQSESLIAPEVLHRFIQTEDD